LVSAFLRLWSEKKIVGSKVQAAALVLVLVLVLVLGFSFPWG
jgi:hypothetical protein